MGWKSGADKGAAIGSWFGPGGAMVGAGLGALLSSSKKKVIIIDDDGVYFVESKIQTDWSDVKEIALQEEGLFRIELRGGLTIITRSGWIHWDEDWLKINDKECTGNCEHTQLFDDDIDLEVYDGVLATAIEDVFWAADLADEIRNSEHMLLCESLLLRYYCYTYAVLSDFDTEVNTIEDENKAAKKFKSFLSVIEDTGPVIYFTFSSAQNSFSGIILNKLIARTNKTEK